MVQGAPAAGDERVLADGGRVRLRPVREQDSEALVALHGRLSDESVYLRYFSPHRRLSSREIDRATHVDHRDREAFVVESEGRLIAVGSYEREPGSDAAEVAFEVDDACQGRGIGTLLFEALAAAARERGIRRFVANVLPHNRRMLQLFRDAGLEEHARFEGGVVAVELALGLEPALDAEALEALAAAPAYGDDAVAAVEHVQTHLSHVFLTADRVYKFRKAVDLPFVHFATRAQRNADCLREIALNRRLAPDVYLGVAPWLGTRLGAVSEELWRAQPGVPPPEHCVVMRRLPAGRDALSLLERGQLTDPQLDAAALTIARFHERASLGAPAPFPAEAWRERCVRPALDNLRVLGEHAGELLEREVLVRLTAATRERAAASSDCFERRRQAGRGVDGHGDLHLQHFWFEHEAAQPIAIDCLEFDDDLRRIDAAADVAFTAMDLHYRGAALRAERFLALYARERDDFDLYGVVDFFASYRAAVRAKVAALAAGDDAIETAQRERAARSARSHLELALRLLAARPPGALILVGGIVGTGKSSAAAELAAAGRAVVIASDRVRKRLAGIAATARRHDGIDEGIYAPEQSERVYAGMLERAAPVLASGRSSILDATWSRAADREQARRFARERGLRCLFVETRCGRGVVLERLARREAEGRDPSDAGPDFHDRSAARFEPVSEWPAGEHLVIDTGSDGWRSRLRGLADTIRSKGL
jgi:aminoglycoside phosphotransferase family enzyme/predicted kinase/RimJ/RimL family protein N-acetyltransferase